MQIKNLTLALITSSIWGSSFLMIKYSLNELNPSDIAIYRIVIGAIFINIFVRTNEKIEKSDHIWMLIISFFWMALPFYMFGIAEQTITSSLAGLINGSTPIFVAFIAVVFYKLKVTRLQLIYIFLIVIKIVMRYASLLSLLMFGFTATFKIPTLEVSLIPMMILGIGGTGIAFLSYYKLLNNVGRISSSFVVYMIPIFSIFFGYQFLNEITNSIQFVGIGIILSSAFLYSRTQSI